MRSNQRRLIVEGLAAQPGSAVRLAGEDAHYVARVLRLGVGDSLALCDGEGSCHEARIVARRGAALSLEVVQSSRLEPPPTPRLHLVFGLAKSQSAELTLQKCTELGIDAVTFARCERSISRPDERKRARWREIARQAARQSERAYLPRIDGPLALPEALARCSGSVRLIAAVGAAGAVGALAGEIAATRDEVSLAVGPEGGFSRSEVAAAAALGFSAVTLGPTVLRSETAAITLVALAAHLTGRLQGAPK